MKVVIGMSGGVDSTVAAFLLKQQGYEVIGLTYKMMPNDNVDDAIKVAHSLEIEHHVIDISDDFKETVIDRFINDYKNGLTPNPCVICNRKIKFKYLFHDMNTYNASYMATGHYARVIDGNIYKSRDEKKDQSYFLCGIDKQMIDKILFPLEGLSKEDVRKIARDNELFTANKKDSYDVCFIKDDFQEFIKNNVSSNPGKVINIDTNEIIGKHKGLMYYTIGQRKGLNIGGNEDRLFVVKKDLDKNILYVGSGDKNEYLYSNQAIIRNFNFLTEDKPSMCMAKFRYHQVDIPVRVNYINEDTIEVFYEMAKAVTPGQFCVMYDGDKCLGGGIVDKVTK